MDNSEEIVNLLKDINSNLDYILASLPNLSEIESLLEQILGELQAKESTIKPTK